MARQDDNMLAIKTIYIRLTKEFGELLSNTYAIFRRHKLAELGLDE